MFGKKLQLALDSETKKMSAAADTALHVGIQQSATTIWTQKEPIDGYHSRLLPEIPETEQSEDSSTSQDGIWIVHTRCRRSRWSAHRMDAYRKPGIPLMLVVGAGGIASLLLSPLAEAKSNALDSLDSSHRHRTRPSAKSAESSHQRLPSSYIKLPLNRSARTLINDEASKKKSSSAI